MFHLFTDAVSYRPPKEYQRFDQMCDRGKANDSNFLDKMRTLFISNSYKIEKSRDIYPVYNKAYKIAIDPNSTQEYKAAFSAMLRCANGRLISRVGAPPIAWDFDPIIKLISDNKNNVGRNNCNEIKLHCETQLVDHDDHDQVNEAAIALDRLCNEGVGFSFGVGVFKAVISSKDAYCVVAKDNDGKIIACALGTLIEITKNTGQVVRVFHVWMCMRSANHPSIHFVDKLSMFKDELIDKHKPDFISLSVDTDNYSARAAYNMAGFVKTEEKYNSYSQSFSEQMLLKTSARNVKIPTSNEIRSALNAQGFNMLGVGWGLAYMISFKVTQIARNFWYK